MSSTGNPRRYFSRERRTLRILGVSLEGEESVFYKIYSTIALGIFQIGYPIAQSGDLFKYDFDGLAEEFVYVVGTSMAVLIITIVFFNRLKVGRLIKKLEQEPFVVNEERGGDAEEKLLQGWFSLTLILSLVFMILVVVSVGVQTVYTFILRLRSSDYHDWRFSFGPLTRLNVTYSPNFEITWAYQNVCFFCIGFSMSSCTLLLAGILENVSVQFQMLQNNLRRMPLICYRRMVKDHIWTDSKCLSDGDLDISVIPWKYLRRCVKEAVAYHLDIFEVIQEFDDMFSMLIVSLYLGSLSMLCFEVYRATLIPLNDPRLVRLLVEYATVVFQVFMICFCGQRVANESDRVAQAASEVQFVGSDLRFQQALQIITQRSQKTAVIKAGKLIETSLITFAWICRTSYSAFMVLRSVNEENA